METLVWNERTGHLVGGHQRLDVLDELEGGQDYHLDVAVIDVDEARERELNVRLNNVGLMGEYDFGKLSALLDTPELSLTALGFDPIDLQAMFPGRGGVFDKSKDTMQPAVDALKAMKPQAYEPEPTDDEEGEKAPPGETLQAMKAAEKEYKAKKAREGSHEYMLHVVFGDRAELDAFLTKAGLPLGEKFVDGRRLATLLGLAL